MRRFILPAVLVASAAMPAAAPLRERRTSGRDSRTSSWTRTSAARGRPSKSWKTPWRTSGGWRARTFKVTFRSKFTFTYGDRTLIEIDAGRVDVQRAECTFPGPRADLVVETGIRAALRVPGQGMLTLDHGYLKYLVSFDENGEFLGVEVLKDAGGHPAFDSEVFCDVATEALGIPTS